MDLARSTSSDAFMSSVRNIAYVFMVLGAIICVSMTIQAALQETAAGDMARLLKQNWFRALLRQDMAYHDIKNVAEQATIISSSGQKFKSKHMFICERLSASLMRNSSVGDPD